MPGFTSTTSYAMYTKRKMVLHAPNLQLHFVTTKGELTKFSCDI